MDYSISPEGFLTTSPSIANASSQVISSMLLIIILLVFVVYLMASWKIFIKAGKPGWAVLIPIYSLFVLLKIIKLSPWIVLVILIPFLGSIIFSIIISLQLAKAFGKSEVFGVVFLFLFPLVGYLILGFGKSKYIFSSSQTVENPAQPSSVTPVA